MKDDHIESATRTVLIIVIPFLAAAFVVLYFLPDQTGQFFAWSIKPHMTALIMGSGYISGGYLFLYAVFGKRWHRIAAAFPAVTIFTTSMLAATILHWDRFDFHHFPFQVWLVLYIITPFIVPWLWLRNHLTDPGTFEEVDTRVPEILRWGMRMLGLGFAVLTVFMFLMPASATAIWPWKLTPLTARVLGGWFSLMAAGAFSVASDARWSAWRIPLQSFSLWAVLVLAGTFSNIQEFGSTQSVQVFISLMSGSLLALVGIQIWMEIRLRQTEHRLRVGNKSIQD